MDGPRAWWVDQDTYLYGPLPPNELGETIRTLTDEELTAHNGVPVMGPGSHELR